MSELPALVALPRPIVPRPAFLPPGATTAQLIRAARENHCAWFGNDFRVENGVRWKAGLIAFPEMPERIASAQLDAIVAFHREREPQTVACWSLVPTRPRDLGARLVARGFEWGWRPHWMALDLHRVRADFPLPKGLEIRVENDADWAVDDLPYYTRGQATLAAAEPRRQWRFGAWLEGRIVGQSCLQVTTGRLGVAGLYNVGVVPAARHRGIGRAVSLAACQFARALGCHHALLNAATSIYERLGFVSLGWGHTWFLHTKVLEAPPPTTAQVSYFEAVGRGSTRALDALRRQYPDEDLDRPLASGLAMMDLAVLLRQQTSADWLARHGATLDIVSAWDLGDKERAAALLARSPQLANRRTGPRGMTPLHVAAERDDRELARLVLQANPDRTLRDLQYNGTPLNWAEVLGRPEIAAMLRKQHLPEVP